MNIKIIIKEFDEKEWEEIQKEIKEIDKKGGRANTIGVNIISKIIYIKRSENNIYIENDLVFTKHRERTKNAS